MNLFLKKSVTALIFLVGFVSMGWCQERESKIFPYKYHLKDLPNGLRIIVIPTDYPNIVALQIPVQTGSRNEVEPGKSGFAHFFEHVMFRGTKNYSSEAYAGILKNAGADQNAFTTDDYTNYHTTFSKEDLETILMLEADRFQNLSYDEAAFKTEARAVLGEYNKNAANPINKLLETQRALAFEKHTYRHTTMGFIEDIENMPNQYDYSLEFFDRYYRPEKTVVVIAGDVEPNHVFSLMEKYWGKWERGSFQSKIPAEPKHDEAVYTHVNWPSATLAWMSVGFHGPAWSDKEIDMPAMDLISSISFSSSSPLYQKLVIEEQKVDQLTAYFPDRKDPYLVTVFARLKDPADAWYVRGQIQRELARLREELVSERRLRDIQKNLKYSFATAMEDSESIAAALPGYLARSRDPESINQVYRLYDSITPADIRATARKYFVDSGMVVVSLAHGDLPDSDDRLGSVDKLAAEGGKVPEIETVLLKSSSPNINFRILFNTGAAQDPKGKEGLANLTAAMITEAGSRSMTYKDIQRMLYPIAAQFGNQVDKEMTVFGGLTHGDNLETFYEIMRDQLLNPGWREEDFRRVKSDMINAIEVQLKGNNDEELAKEVLYEAIYRNHPYGSLNLGHIQALENITLDDIKNFYASHYTRANLVLGLAGNLPDELIARIKTDLAQLPEGREQATQALPQPNKIEGLQVQIVKKDTRATAISLGFPIDINRSHTDFTALWLARSYFGEHRSTNSYLFQRIREIRGMNYGDYAYIEYFPSGMFQFHPDANLGRQQQIFQLWIRPVVPQNGHFALRLAKYELDKLLREGISQEDFEATRNYLMKFVNVLAKSQDRQLGYALDSRYYAIPEFTGYIRKNLERLTREEVNRVIREYLRNENLQVAIITKDADDLRRRLIENTPSPIQYDAQKPAEILAEDKIIQSYRLDIKAENIKILDLENVFR